MTPASGTVGTAFSFTVTALDANNNTAAGYSGTVGFTSTDPQAVLPKNSSLVWGTATFSATFYTAGNQTITATDTATPSLTGTSNSVSVNKATPTVKTWPTAGAITYGQTLASSTLSGGAASVPGTFAFTSPTTAPNIGTSSQSVTFTPTDAAGYNTVTGSVKVTVNKATPSVTNWPAASAITYGQALSASTLSGGSALVAGHFAFTTPSLKPSAGTAAQSVTFTPTNSTDYTSTTGTASVTVHAATPTVRAWPTASAITYGQTLASSTLSGGAASVPGTFAFTAPTTAPNIGANSQSVTFTPTDATDYNTVTGSVKVTVNKATPGVTWPTAGAITYGQALSASTLSGGSASVAGGFAFTTPSLKPSARTAAQSVTFAPTDAADYNTVKGSVSVTVNKATPGVAKWPTASAITYGQALSASTLSGGSASVARRFAFTTPSLKPSAGTTPQSVTFTPYNSTDYNSVTETVNVTVRKATPTVRAWPTSGAITYGQELASSTLSGGAASVPGIFAFTAPTTAPKAGANSQSVTFTPTDATDYNTVTGSVKVTVNKATPSVTNWPAASAITYGQALSASTLSGGVASVAGSFAFTTPSLKPSAGTALQSVTFTPTDATDYNKVTGSVSVTVN